MCLRMFCCCEKDDMDEFEYSVVPHDDDIDDNKEKNKKIYRVISYSCKKNGIRLHSNVLTYKNACIRVSEIL